MTDAIDIDLLGHSQHHINHHVLGVLRAQQQELDSLHAQVAALRRGHTSLLALVDLCALKLGLISEEEIRDNVASARAQAIAASHPKSSSDQSDDTWEEFPTLDSPGD